MAKQPHLPASTPVPAQQHATPPPPAPPPADSEGSGLSIGDLFAVIGRRKWTVLGCFLVVFAAFAVYTYLQEPSYQATAVLNIESAGTATQMNSVLANEGVQNPDAAVEALFSPQVALGVAERVIALGEIPGTDVPFSVLEGIPTDSPSRTSQVAQRIANSRITSSRRSTKVVTVAATSPVPEEAAFLANAYAEEYIDYSRETSRANLTEFREFLEETTERFNEQVTATEDDLTSYLNSVGVSAPGELGRELLTDVSQLRRTQGQTEMEIATVQTEVGALQDQLERLTPGLGDRLTSREDLAIDRLAEEIANLEVQRDQILARYPELRGQEPTGQLAEIEDQIAYYNEQLREQTTRLLENAAPTGDGAQGPTTGTIQSKMARLYTLREQIQQKQIQLQTLETRLEQVNEQLAELTPQLSSIPQQEVALNRLNRDLQIQEGLYERFLSQLQQARVAEQAEPGQATIVAEALVPLNPLSPNVQRNLVAGAIIGILLGIGLAFVRNAMDDEIHTPADLQHQGYTLLGVIPDMKAHIKEAFSGQDRIEAHGRPISTRLLAHLSPQSPVADGYRRLRTNLQFSGLNGSVHTVLVTSSTPNEGKTVTAMNLAYTMAQSGRRTLYIDADLHAPAGHRLVQIDKEPGLVDLLQGSPPPTLEEAIVDVDGVSILPAGSPPGKFAAELLHSNRMRDLLARLREQYDAIVIDTAPVLAVADAILLSSICDASILVSRSGMTPNVALARATEALGRVGTPIAGVVLNGFDDRGRSGYDGYGYYGQFGYGQSDGAEGSRSRRLGEPA